MHNPYRMLDGWATLPDGVTWGAVIGIIPDGEGDTWIHHRSEPPDMHFDATGAVTHAFGEGMFVMATDSAETTTATSGPVTADHSVTTRTEGRGYQFFKFSPEGEQLLILGDAGVSRAGPWRRSDAARRIRGPRRPHGGGW